MQMDKYATKSKIDQHHTSLQVIKQRMNVLKREYGNLVEQLVTCTTLPVPKQKVVQVDKQCQA